VAVGLLAALVLVFFWRVLLGGETLAPGRQQWLMEPWRSGLAADRQQHGRQWDALLWDAMGQYVPWRTYAARTLRSGAVPLWNPHQFCGTPFAANAQSAIFYPPNVLFVLFDPLRALGLSAALHFLLAGAGTYALLRRMALGSPASFVGAVSFTFGGFMVTWTELPTLMNTASWLPCCILAAHAFFSRPRWRTAALLGAALAMAFLAGHPQIFMYVAGTTVLYCLARLAKWLATRQATSAPGPIALLLGAAALTALLCAVQFLPTAELLQRGHRGIRAPSEAMWQAQVDRALKPAELPTLLVPDVHGSPALGTYFGWSYTEHCGFVGAVVLALALVALILRRNGHTLFFAALALGSILVAMATPLGRLLFFGVPGFAAAGSVTRTLCVFTFGMAVLGAMGLDAVLRVRSESTPSRWSRVSAVVILLVGAVALGLWIRIGPPSVADPGALGAWWGGLLPFAVACAVGVVLWLPSARLSAAEAGAVIVLLILAELFNYGSSFNPTVPRDGVYASVPAVQVMQAEQGDGRTLAITRRADWRLFAQPKALLPPNSATVYGLQSVQGYDSLSTARYREYAHLMEGAQPSPLANGNMVLLENVGSPLLDRAAVGLVVSAQPLLDEHLTRVWSDGFVHVYRNTRALPRAYVAARGVLVDGDASTLAALRTLNPNAPRAPVVQTQGAPTDDRRPQALQRPALQAAPIVADEPNAVTVSIPGPAAQWARWLVLTDALYPGWHCYVDDEERPIVFADYLFRAVVLDASTAEVRFVYFPQSFLVGAFLACVGAAVLSATLVRPAARRRLARRRGRG